MAYTYARVNEGSVTLGTADGAAVEYKKTDGAQSGWKPPKGYDDVLSVDGGKIHVQADDGRDYEFDSSGRLTKVTSAVDDRNPAALQYEYGGNPTRLQRIVDPVSGQRVYLDYGGDMLDDRGSPTVSACSSSVPSGFLAAPPGMLCGVTTWDTQTTRFWYVQSLDPQFGVSLGRVEAFASTSMPAKTDFAYGEFGKLSLIRSPLAADAIAAGVRTDSASNPTQTMIDYVSEGSPEHIYKVASIVAPEPQPTAARPKKTFTYSASSAIINTWGTPATNDRTVTWDGSLRLTRDQDPTGKDVYLAYDAEDRVIAKRDAQTGMRTSTQYDHAGRPVASYGPAKQSYFQTGGTYYVTPQNNLDKVQVTRTAYDNSLVPIDNSVNENTGVLGLGVAYYANPDVSGAPVMHRTGAQADGATNDGTAYRSFGTGGPGGSMSSGIVNNFSMRMTGDITFPSTGTYKLYTRAAGGTRVFLDDRYLVGDITAETPSGTIDSPKGDVIVAAANEKHRIRVEFSDRSADASVEFRWVTPTGTDQRVPATALAPRYGLVTRTITGPANTITTTNRPAGTVPVDSYAMTTTTYSGTGSGVRPEFGKPVKATKAAGTSLAVSTLNTYEDSAVTAANSHNRLLSSQTPVGGPTTSYAYYPDAVVETDQWGCGQYVDGGGGLLRFEKTPDPDGGGAELARWHEKKYSLSGAIIGTRTGTSTAMGSWTCSTLDGRRRVASTLFPAFGGSSVRTVSNSYSPAVGTPAVPNPLAVSTTDPAGTITSETDLLGQTIAYTDVWNRRTTYLYDQAGRLTTTQIPGLSAITRTFDAQGRLAATAYGGQTSASMTYAVDGRVSEVTYPAAAGGLGNGTKGVFGINPDTRQPVSIDWQRTSGATPIITQDLVTRDLFARVRDQRIDGSAVDLSGSSAFDYNYDALGRLTTAKVSNGAGGAINLTYGFGANPQAFGTDLCTQSWKQSDAARRFNRSAASIPNGTGAPSTFSYCYDNSDRLRWTDDGDVGTITYDAHGNTTAIFGETRTYDIADRHLATAKSVGDPAVVTEVKYKRDAADRIVEALNTVTTPQPAPDPPSVVSTKTRYGFTGSSDAPSVILDENSVVHQATISLPGGVLVTLQVASPTPSTWSYPNLHGDVVATADAAGVEPAGAHTAIYDPYGNVIRGTTPTTTVPENAEGTLDYGWLGQHQRGLEHMTGLEPITEMGARQYSARLGRFIEADPIAGGSCNDYDYACADPVNGRDLDGNWSIGSIFRKIGRFVAVGLHAFRGGTHSRRYSTVRRTATIKSALVGFSRGRLATVNQWPDEVDDWATESGGSATFEACLGLCFGWGLTDTRQIEYRGITGYGIVASFGVDVPLWGSQPESGDWCGGAKFVAVCKTDNGIAFSGSLGIGLGVWRVA